MMWFSSDAESQFFLSPFFRSAKCGSKNFLLAFSLNMLYDSK